MVPSSPSPRVSGPCPPSSSLTHSSSSSSHSSHSHSHSHSHSANSGSESSSASSSPSASPLEQLRTIKTNPEHHKHDTGKQNTTTHQTRRLSVEPLTSTPLIDKPTASSANPPQPTKMTESIRLASQHRLEQEPFIEEEGESERYRVPSPSSGQIDIKNHRYPFCLVWGPLPLISWIFPWIGHLGIADSEGKVHDFAGPYYIGIDSFMTPIFKYYQFPREVWYGKEAAWNAGVVQADSEYRKLMHNICCQNCHHHTARALSNMTLGPNHLPQFTMMSAWWLITRKGKFVSWPAWLCTYMPLICGVALILAIALWSS